MGHGCSFLAKEMMGTECLSKMGWGLHLMPDMDLLWSEYSGTLRKDTLLWELFLDRGRGEFRKSRKAGHTPNCIPFPSFAYLCIAQALWTAHFPSVGCAENREQGTAPR